MTRNQFIVLMVIIACWLASIIYALYQSRQRIPDEVERINDENTMRVAQECFRTGKPVVGSVDDAGRLTMRVLDDEESARKLKGGAA